MTPAINHVLDEILHFLHENVGVHSPASVFTTASHNASRAGVGEADNISDANDAIDKYIADIVDELVRTCGMKEDDAFDFVFNIADSTADEDHIPALPDEEADPEELATWLGKANTYGFAAKVVQAAKDRHAHGH